MDIKTIITTIITSSFIATILSSIVNFYLRKLDFKNDYFKRIIDKRISSYELLEKQIGDLKYCVVDDKDQLPYHLMFSNGYDDYIEFKINIGKTNSCAIWLNKLTHDKFTELMHLIDEMGFEFDMKNNDQLIKSGQKYYREIGRIRDELENLTRSDILSLYDFSKIKQKRTSTKFNHIINIKS